MTPSRKFWLRSGAVAGVMFGVGIVLGKFVPARASDTVEGTTGEGSGAVVRIPTEGVTHADADFSEVFYRLQGATTSEFVSEMESGLDGGFSDERELLAFALRWVIEDAEGGAELLFELFGDGDGEHDINAARYFDVVEAFLMMWTKQDHEGMVSFVRKLEEQGHPWGEEFMEEFVELPRKGAKGAAAHFASFDPANVGYDSSQVDQEFYNFAQADPRAVATLIGEYSGRQRSNALKWLARSWSDSDPSAALEWAEGLAIKGDRKIALDAAIGGIAKKDLPTAMEWFERFPKELAGSFAASVITHELGKEDPQRALLWYHEQLESAGDAGSLPHLSPWQFGSHYNSVSELLPRAPAELRAFLDELPDGAFKDRLMTEGLSNEPRIDYTSSAGEFLAEIAEMPDDDLRTSILSGGLQAWAVHDPKAAREAVLGFEGALREGAAVKLLSSYHAFGSAAEAVEFARATEVDPDAISSSISGPMTRWSDVSAAADFFASASDFSESSSVAQFVAAWAKESPQEALSWIEDRPGENPALIEKVVSSWLRSDLAAASEWALGLEAPAARAASAAAIANSTRHQDPEASFAWALEVPDEVQREELLRNAYLSWKDHDRDAANGALGGEGVPDGLREIFFEE